MENRSKMDDLGVPLFLETPMAHIPDFLGHPNPPKLVGFAYQERLLNLQIMALDIRIQRGRVPLGQKMRQTKRSTENLEVVLVS